MLDVLSHFLSFYLLSFSLKHLFVMKDFFNFRGMAS